MLDYKYIEQLLERYFECDTTLEEECILRSFFAQKTEQVPTHLLTYRQIFREQQLSNCEEMLGTDFDRKVLAAIGQEERHQPMHVKIRRITMSRQLRPLYKAAACVAVVLSLVQAAQMPYNDAATEQREDFARSIEMLQRIQQDKNTVAQGDTIKPMQQPTRVE